MRNFFGVLATPPISVPNACVLAHMYRILCSVHQTLTKPFHSSDECYYLELKSHFSAIFSYHNDITLSHSRVLVTVTVIVWGFKSYFSAIFQSYICDISLTKPFQYSKTCVKQPLKNRQNKESKILMTNGSLMKVKNNAECSP